MKKSSTIFFIAATIGAFAQNSLPVKKVTIFKNSTAMVVKEGTSPLSNGQIVLPIPDKALAGTYFLGAAKDNSVKSIAFKNDTIKKKTLCASVWQYIAGNVGKPATISYNPSANIDKTLSGTILDYNLNTGIVKFKGESGKISVLHTGSIYQVDFKEAENNFYMADSVKRMLVLKPEKPADNISLQEIFMTGGVNWIPSYYLRLKDDKNARLEMKAVIENFAEDLRDTEVELVVGAPQMINSAKLDPMTYDYLTTGFFDNDNSRSRNYTQSNAMATMAFKTEEDAGGYFDSNFETEGEKSGDMYIYKLGKISLSKSTKGSFPIFAGNVEYKDKYEGSIYDITNYTNTRFVPQEEKPFDIFHSLEVKNTAQVPLTTASVMVVNEKEQFVAQDELKYTPVGATNNIRLSKAIDIIMKNSEEEKSREDNAKKIGKTTYSKVVIKGVIPVQNYQNKDVTVNITKTLSGTVNATSDAGKVIKKNSYNYINPTSEIKWELTLKAGGKQNLTYEYELFFVP
jgi:hypothetical protein